MFDSVGYIVMRRTVYCIIESKKCRAQHRELNSVVYCMIEELNAKQPPSGAD